jgi:hypothetical protein
MVNKKLELLNILLLPRAKHVYGYEVVPEAIADAQKNAKLNGINNATFVQGDLNKINDTFGKEFPKPDIIISGLSFLVYLATCHYCPPPKSTPLLMHVDFVLKNQFSELS